MKELLFVSFMSILLLGCTLPPEPEKGKIMQSQSLNNCEIQDYNNGVYYFNCVSYFPENLSKFAETHKIVSIAANGNGIYGSTNGFIVVTE